MKVGDVCFVLLISLHHRGDHLAKKVRQSIIVLLFVNSTIYNFCGKFPYYYFHLNIILFFGNIPHTKKQSKII